MGAVEVVVGTTGGATREIYKVTNLSDDDVASPKEGTMCWGVTREKPIWVTFEKDMVINLKHERVVTSDTTIDAKVEICNGAGRKQKSHFRNRSICFSQNDLHRLKIKATALKSSPPPPPWPSTMAIYPHALPSSGVMPSFVSALQYFPDLGFDAFLILTILQV
ncbi:hypothetical protein L6452_34621 [Arctium lappa]|uniref:Uncharacterized protein n=1 Tax=Arctium lappa TaxID=4217 RepID=A0ACB8YHY7_ARCLA|nr:hypothetical protein L6452_34621 [Arctium lappa]